MIPATTGQDDPVHEQRASQSVDSPLQVALTGAKGGFVATFVMTAYRLPISRSLPPTDEFWTTFVSKGDSDSAVLPAIVLHVLYGTGAGVAFVTAVAGLSNTNEARAELEGVLTAVVYSIFLSIFGQRVILETILGQKLSADESLVFHLGHVVYGITLGTWIGLRRPN